MREICSNGKAPRSSRADDPVAHPSHYTDGRKYEPVKVIQDWELDFCLGNVVKYVSRAGRKDPTRAIEDLEKARQYLTFKIDALREQPRRSEQS